MKAEILCVGTELLLGQIVNTNASYLAAELALVGVDVLWISTVGDNMPRMLEALALASGRADLIVLSGGLGPTPDDLSVEAIARHVGEPLVERASAREHVEAYFERRKRPMVASNLKQAFFPASAELIPNAGGSALGVSIEHDGTWILAFPGVPWELKAMFEQWAAPRLAARSQAVLRSALLKYAGIGEAALAERVGPWLSGANPTVAPYAGAAEVHLRVTAKAASPEEAEALLAPVVTELSAIAPFYFGRDRDTLPAVVGRLLGARNETLGLAESCTGGLLASRLTDVPGASGYFRGSVVAYASELKATTLGVSQALLLSRGAVNDEVARELAVQARRVLTSDWGVGVTGYAGPAPELGNEDVGLVYVAVAGPADAENQAAVEEWRFGADTPREQVKLRATQAALDLLRRRLLES